MIIKSRPSGRHRISRSSNKQQAAITMDNCNRSSIRCTVIGSCELWMLISSHHCEEKCSLRCGSHSHRPANEYARNVELWGNFSHTLGDCHLAWCCPSQAGILRDSENCACQAIIARLSRQSPVSLSFKLTKDIERKYMCVWPSKKSCKR